MSLNASSCAASVWVEYCNVAALNPDGSPVKDGVAKSGFGSMFANVYNDYAMDGVVPGTVNEGGDTSILASAISPDGATDITDLALAFAEYWDSVAISPGDPAHGGTGVVSVSNNAIAMVDDFQKAIEDSITTVESTPYYEAFISNLESVVKTIIWTVIETMPPSGSPTPHQASIT